MDFKWKSLLFYTGILLLVTLGFVTSGAFIFAIALLALFYLNERGDSTRANSGYEVETDESEAEWTTVYKTRWDQGFVAVLTSKLRSEDIPCIVENKNLFNSGMQIKFGLSVPMKVLVPTDQEQAARRIIREFGPES